jgi:hypothetical protein
VKRPTVRRPDEDYDGHPRHPLPRRLAAMSARNRIIVAVVGIVVGVVLMFGGLKLVSDDVNQPNPPTPQPSGG